MDKQGKEPIDFQKLRKKRMRANRLKQLGVLAIICFLIVATLYINDAMVRRNVTNELDGYVGSWGGEGFPTPIPSGAIKHVGGMGKNLAVLKESNIYVYSEKGKQLKNIQQLNDRSIMKTTSDKLLFYTTNGTHVSVHSPTNQVYDNDVGSNIDYADIGADGYVAVISSPQKFVSELTVYNPKGELLSTRSFAEDLFSILSVSPRGEKVAATSISSNQGLLDYNLNIFRSDTGDPAFVIPVGNRMVLDLNFYREDTVAVLTDIDCLIYDTNNGKLLGSYVFAEGTQLIEFRRWGSQIVLLLREHDTRKYIVVSLDQMAKEKGNKRFDDKPLDITFNDKKVYISFGGILTEYDSGLKEIKKHDIEPVERIYLLDANLYLIGKTEVDIFSEQDEKEEVLVEE